MKNNFILHPIKLANAAAFVAISCHVLYLIVFSIAPNPIHAYMASIMPGYKMSSIETIGVAPGMAVFGAAMLGITVWVLVAATAWVYNKLAA